MSAWRNKTLAGAGEKAARLVAEVAWHTPGAGSPKKITTPPMQVSNPAALTLFGKPQQTNKQTNKMKPKRSWSINQFTKQPKTAVNIYRDRPLFINEKYSAAEDCRGQTYVRDPRTGQITKVK